MNMTTENAAAMCDGRSGGRKRGLRKSVWFSPFFLTLSVITVIAVAVYIASRCSVEFAEFWSRYPAVGIRFLTSALTSLLPFSFAEALIILAPFALVTFVVLTVKAYISARKCSDENDSRSCDRRISKLLCSVVSMIMIVTAVFGLGFGPSYFRKPLAENLGLDDEPVSGEALYGTAVWLTNEINAIVPEIDFAAGGESRVCLSFSELNDIVGDAFGDFTESQDFISDFPSSVKQIALSDPMTYTHISGVYTFFTGEANVNINYPDFIIPYTIAHEMSHQRGIAREDEANFIAFLVCIGSENAYVRYSGYVNVLREVMSALGKADKTLYGKYRSQFYPTELAGEMRSYSLFFDKYRDSAAAAVVSKTNDAYLKSQSVASGVKNYGLVTDLAVAYYLTNIA